MTSTASERVRAARAAIRIGADVRLDEVPESRLRVDGEQAAGYIVWVGGERVGWVSDEHGRALVELRSELEGKWTLKLDLDGDAHEVAFIGDPADMTAHELAGVIAQQIPGVSACVTKNGSVQLSIGSTSIVSKRIDQ